MHCRRIATTTLVALIVGGCGSSAGDIQSRVAVSSTVSASSSTIDLGSGVVGSTPTTAAKVGSTTTVLVPPITDPATGASSVSLASGDLTSISNAFQSFTNFPCTVQPIEGTVKAATVGETGVVWAIATMQPTAGCTIHDGSGATVDPNQVPPFESGYPETSGVFEREPGGLWVMNWFQSDPFPCPPNLAVSVSTPGPDSAYIPTAVAAAMGLTFASEAACSPGSIYIPPHPQ